MTEPELDPSHIMQVGMGFFGARTLLTAVELELFTHLAVNQLTGAGIAEHSEFKDPVRAVSHAT